MMRPVAAEMLALDRALRLVDLATAHLSRRTGKAARQHILDASNAARAVVGRLVIAERASGLDASPEAARENVAFVLATARRSGALQWFEVVALCNEVAETVPPAWLARAAAPESREERP